MTFHHEVPIPLELTLALPAKPVTAEMHQPWGPARKSRAGKDELVRIPREAALTVFNTKQRSILDTGVHNYFRDLLSCGVRG